MSVTRSAAGTRSATFAAVPLRSGDRLIGLLSLAAVGPAAPAAPGSPGGVLPAAVLLSDPSSLRQVWTSVALELSPRDGPIAECMHLVRKKERKKDLRPSPGVR
jgi:hypothetical protein